MGQLASWANVKFFSLQVLLLGGRRAVQDRGDLRTPLETCRADDVVLARALLRRARRTGELEDKCIVPAWGGGRVGRGGGARRVLLQARATLSFYTVID